LVSRVKSTLMLCLVAGFASCPLSAASPDLDLLEFLGEWEDSDGKWLDPLALVDNGLSEADLKRIARSESAGEDVQEEAVQ